MGPTVPPVDFYPRPPRGGRPAAPGNKQHGKMISIHALREEGDHDPPGQGLHLVISIHALREEGDKKPLDYGILGVTFLSTPSARRATLARSGAGRSHGISIHALREEGDTINQLRQAFQVQFLSTPSARRATNFFPKTS